MGRHQVLPTPDDRPIDITVWKDVLYAYRVDETAQQELYLLAQYSAAGHKAANAIIGKLLKKASEYEAVQNTSAFVHACVQNVRHKWAW